MKPFCSMMRTTRNRYAADVKINVTTTFVKDAELKTGGDFTGGRR